MKFEITAISLGDIDTKSTEYVNPSDKEVKEIDAFLKQYGYILVLSLIRRK